MAKVSLEQATSEPRHHHRESLLSKKNESTSLNISNCRTEKECEQGNQQTTIDDIFKDIRSLRKYYEDCIDTYNHLLEMCEELQEISKEKEFIIRDQ